jgi:hypothetical protein
MGAYTACPHDRPLAKAVEVLKANFRRGEVRDSRCFTIRPQVSVCQNYVCILWPAGSRISQLRRNSAYAVSSDRQAA